MYLNSVAAGFPSPAEDYIDRKLDLQEYAIKNPSATYFARAAGDSMIEAGIFNGDLLIVDRSIQARSGSVVVAAVDGELTVKYLVNQKDRVLLCPGNPDYPEIDITDREDTILWGVVTYVLHKPEFKAVGAR